MEELSVLYDKTVQKDVIMSAVYFFPSGHYSVFDSRGDLGAEDDNCVWLSFDSGVNYEYNPRNHTWNKLINKKG